MIFNFLNFIIVSYKSTKHFHHIYLLSPTQWPSLFPSQIHILFFHNYYCFTHTHHILENPRTVVCIYIGIRLTLGADSLSRDLSQKQTDSSSICSHLLPVALQLGIEPHVHFLFWSCYIDLDTIMQILSRQLHGLEFLDITSLSFQKTILQQLSWSSGSFNLLPSLSQCSKNIGCSVALKISHCGVGTP